MSPSWIPAHSLSDRTRQAVTFHGDRPLFTESIGDFFIFKTAVPAILQTHEFMKIKYIANFRMGQDSHSASLIIVHEDKRNSAAKADFFTFQNGDRRQFRC